MEEESQEIFVLYDDKGKRWEFSDSPENAVVVRLEEPFRESSAQYMPGDEIVIPVEIAKRIKCKILRRWK